MRTIKRPNTFKFLTSFSTIDDAKNKYRQLVVKMHPDKGGDVADMQQLNAEWDYIKKTNYIPTPTRPVTPPPRTTPPPQPKPRQEPVRVKLDWEIATAVIDSLYAEAMKKGYKLGSIAFNFVEFVQNNNYMTNKKQMEYIAVKLNYRSGWAYHQVQDLKKKGLAYE